MGTATGQPSAKEAAVFPPGCMAARCRVCTATPTAITLYRNGVQVATTAYTGGWYATPPARPGISVKLNAGGTADTGAPGYWDGLIDDLALWNRPLSAEEVFNVYAAGAAAGEDIAHATPVAPPPGLVMNQYLSNNSGGLEDEDRDTPDWIELCNGTGAAVDLDGYYLSDDATNPTKWRFRP